MARFFSLVTLVCLFFNTKAQNIIPELNSPDGTIQVSLKSNDGAITYAISHKGKNVIQPSSLGLVRADGDFSKSLIFLSATNVQKVVDQYRMVNAKKTNIRYTANRRVYKFLNQQKQPLEIIFQVSNDGVAFHYFFPGVSNDEKIIQDELTSFQFDKDALAWMQPMQVAKTGWESTNPAYEEHYQMGIPVGTAAPTNAGWVYPALFKTDDVWVLLTEAALDTNYCGTRLRANSENGLYRISFPDEREVLPGGSLLPKSKLPFRSPWRIATIGSLKTVVESTLGTDLAKPSIKIDPSFVRPGQSSWSWIMSKDDSIVYTEQRRYIDFAAGMNWQYCLVDVNWDQKIGYDKIKELANYAASKNVGLLLWYNSAGSWNTVKYTPKDKLITAKSREETFAQLKAIGIKGVKIDFFAGDGQSVINYYHQILKAAGKYGLMVNFHGATLPRGWHRTYPHLVSAEAVRGFEMVTFSQGDADKQPSHCAILPFTRNVFDPMDFTPMNLYKIPTGIKRKTTSAFELALSVVFQSGIQHFAESPAGMSHMPQYVHQFLRDLPAVWEDIRFIEGFPGQYVVLARKANNKWYLAGINGQEAAKTVELDLSQFGKSKATVFTDASEPTFIEQKSLKANGKHSITMGTNGGFVLVLE